jgi:hypothetical protein
MSTEPQHDTRDSYTEKYGFHDTEQHVFKSRKGLNKDIVAEISSTRASRSGCWTTA